MVTVESGDVPVELSSGLHEGCVGFSSDGEFVLVDVDCSMWSGFGIQ